MKALEHKMQGSIHVGANLKIESRTDSRVPGDKWFKISCIHSIKFFLFAGGC